MSISLILGARGGGQCVFLHSRLLGNPGWLSGMADQAMGMHPFLLSDKADGISTALDRGLIQQWKPGFLLFQAH